jgi:hypothetical protein
VNTYALPKIWFRCHSIELRAGDFGKINSIIKSWLYADLFEKPEELVMHRPRLKGGLGVHHVKYKAQAILIRSFLETALSANFIPNQYHRALYMWHVEGRRDITIPVQPTYYDDNFFNYIKMVKQEGLLNIKTMSSGQWYKVLLEYNVTHQITNDRTVLLPCRAEIKSPDAD